MKYATIPDEVKSISEYNIPDPHSHTQTLTGQYCIGKMQYVDSYFRNNRSIDFEISLDLSVLICTEIHSIDLAILE